MIMLDYIKKQLAERVEQNVQESAKIDPADVSPEMIMEYAPVMAALDDLSIMGTEAPNEARSLVSIPVNDETDEEIDKVVNFINAQREPNYDPRFMDLEDHSVEEVKGDEVKMSAADAKKLRDEELYQFVKEQVYKREYTSISTIERENGIGFTRAGRLFKRLQDEGLVALESEASKGSKVLKENFKFEKKDVDFPFYKGNLNKIEEINPQKTYFKIIVRLLEFIE